MSLTEVEYIITIVLIFLGSSFLQRFTTSILENKSNIFRNLSQKDKSHICDIIIHSFHTIWISILSLICVSNLLRGNDLGLLSVFPFLFLSFFYLSELNIRKISWDVLIHHILVPSVFVCCVYLKTVKLMAFYGVIEIGHIFHFLPYIMYKLGFSQSKWYDRLFKIAIVMFPLLRVIGFAIVGIWSFSLLGNYYFEMTITLQIILPSLVVGLFLIQMVFARDLFHQYKKYKMRQYIPEINQQLGCKSLDIKGNVAEESALCPIINENNE